VAFSPNGKTLAAGSADTTVWLWDIESGKLLRRVRGHGEGVDHVFFLPDGKKGVSLERGRSSLVWDVEGDAEPRKLDTWAKQTALSPDGKLLCFSNGNDTILFDLASGKPISKLGKYCEAVAFSPDGKKVVKTNDAFQGNVVQMWDIETGKQIWSSKGHGDGIKHFSFTSDGKRILSVDSVRLHIWDTENGDELGRYRIVSNASASHFACAPDGKMILVSYREYGRTSIDKAEYGLTLRKLPK
jgi:WD40 repeat protein